MSDGKKPSAVIHQKVDKHMAGIHDVFRKEELRNEFLLWAILEYLDEQHAERKEANP